MTNGFVGIKTDPSLFIYSQGLTKLFILLYVNDIIITRNTLPHITHDIHALSSEFALEDLGPLHYFLGVEVVPYGDGLLLSQQKYILELLQWADLSDAKRVSTPHSPSMTLSTSSGSLFSNHIKYH